MRRSIVFSLVCIVATATCLQATDIRVVAGISEEGAALVGQRRTYFIEVQTDTWFTGPIEITPPSLDGLILVQLEAFGINGTSRIEGTTYTTHRKEFALFALNPGSLIIPPGTVKAKVADPGNPAISFEGKSPGANFTAAMPPGVEEGEFFLTTPSLRVEATWDRDPGKGSVGDAFQRTISMTAEDIMGMVFPPVPDVKIAGVRVYRDPPLVDDLTGRGGLVGSRSEILTYVFEKSGQYVLPAITLSWWDEKNSELKVERIPETTFLITPLDGLDPVAETDGTSIGSDSGFLVEWGIPILSLVGLAVGAFLLGRLVRRRATASADNEKARFADLLKAIDRGDVPDIYRAWRHWRDTDGLDATDPPAPVLQLERTVSGYDDELVRSALRQALVDQRDRLLRSVSEDKIRRLPGLNPE